MKQSKRNISMIQSNIQAINEFETTKSLSIKDLKVIKPLTQPQKQMFESYFYGNFVLATGASGTGKTLISIYLGLNDVLSKSSKQNQLIIVRSAVPSREIGYLPGTEIEKLESYEIPYRDIFTYLFNRKTAYDKMKKQNIVRFIPTSFIRGLTWDNAVIIIDEIQNMTFYELNSVITRVGANSKLIIIGDQMQSDLYRNKNDKSGMKDFLIVANKVEEFDHITFTKNDILRSSFVKSWICALEDSNISN